MKLRLLLFLVTLSLAAVASAQCSICVSDSLRFDGRCQVMPGNRCSYTCCLWGEDAFCDTREQQFGCSDGVAVIPANYFASTLPRVTEGSALRVRIGKAQPVRKRCLNPVRL